MRGPQTEASRRWSIRPICYDRDLGQIAELARVAYPPDIPLAELGYLRWKYLENPAGRPIAVGCETDGQLVGFNGLFPVFVKVGDAIKRCAIPGDTMVHPDFQRQGVYTAMNHSLMENAAKGLTMVYVRTRWLEQPTIQGELEYVPITQIGKVPVLMKILSLSSDSDGAPLGSKGTNVRQIEPLVFSSEFDELWRDVKDSFQVAVVKGKNFLNWRFSMPGHAYMGLRAEENGILSGYCVMLYVPYHTSYSTYYASDELKLGFILDILARSSEAAGSLIEAAIDRAEKDRAQVLIMMETEQTRRFSRQLGFGQAWEESLLALMRSPEIPQDLITNISNWHVTIGDSDWA